ncbi:retrovirus-related pol polyprotein from transposon TNT 1-94 [Tanacetum coccineum]
MKHTKPETHDSLDKSVSETVTISETKPTTPLVPTKVKNTKQESKINELTKLVQMLIDEKILYCMICKREDHRTSDHEMYTASLKRSENYKARPYQNLSECGICGSYDHFTPGHNRVIHIRGGMLAESSQSSEYLINRHIREPICYLDSRCSRSMTGVKSYLHKYVEQPGPKVVFGDNSSCITEGYGSINCGGIVFTKVAFVNGLKYNLISISQLCDAKYIVQFDDKQGTIFNANKEIVLIAPRRNDVYVLDMSSLSPNGACFFAKASESINWLWNKRLSHLNFKNINKLTKQNKVLGLPSLVYSKDKPCTTCEKGKHHRASFKTKQNFSIRKCLHLLHMDLFGPVSPMFINHEKYTLVIVDEYSRYTWVHFLRKKSQAPEIIMSFIRMVENQNDVKVKQIKTDNGTEFRNHKLESKFDAKADDGYFLGYFFVSKAFRVFNTRRQHIRETYHVTFNESIEAIKFTHTSEDEIGIDDSSRYPPDEFVHEDDPSRQYQIDSDISYYVIPYGRSLSELTQDNQVPEVIAPNEPDIPYTEDTEGPPDLINTEGTHEQNVQNDQIITQPTDVPSGNNTEVLGSITESLVPDVTQSHISNKASTSSHLVPQDRWSRDQHIELVNIIGDPGKGMLTRSMAAKLTTASASECLFADFLSEIEPKKVSEALNVTPPNRSQRNIVWEHYFMSTFAQDVRERPLNVLFEKKSGGGCCAVVMVAALEVVWWGVSSAGGDRGGVHGPVEVVVADVRLAGVGAGKREVREECVCSG